MKWIDKNWASMPNPGLLALALLAGCGGGGGGDSEQANSATSFRAYAASAGSDSATPAALTAAEKDEVARHSREWAVATLVTRDTSVGVFGTVLTGATANAVAFPPLHFARSQAVAAAAAGDTLAQLRLSLPATTPAVQAALMRGVTRTVSAGPDVAVTADFMRSVTAAGQVAPWVALTLDQLSAATLASEPRLRLRIVDEFLPSVPWPQVVVFDGVFVSAYGERAQVAMLRVSGPLLSSTSADMTAVALSLPQGRWLVRLTPTGPIRDWSAADLQAALARATADAVGAGAVAAVHGDLVLPAAAFAALGMYDRRGLTLAQDPVNADMRGLDGKGGTYAELAAGTGAVELGAAGLLVHAGTATSFVYSPVNSWAGGSYGVVMTNVTLLPQPLPVACGDADLQPGYLALINELGGLEMLARFSVLYGVRCQ